VESLGTSRSIQANCWGLSASGVVQHATQTKAAGAKASEDVSKTVKRNDHFRIKALQLIESSL